MNRKLFELALDRLRSSDWEHFEELSSQFLVSDFPNLRTMANPSGDGGRDSELFSPEGLSNVVTQYSVASDWDSKIRNTVKRLKETQSNAKLLIYLTNKIIGAKGDKRKSACLTDGIMLDIRDRNWFLERYEVDDSKYGAATSLVNIIAMPYLEGEGLISKKRAALNSQEAKAALIYLGLQFEDESTEKGLTKIAFESLVRAALRNTHTDNRMHRSLIYERIESYISSYPIDNAKKYIDSALSRLTKKYIRHWSKVDEFCLMHNEVTRLKEKLAEQECDESDFDVHIDAYLLSITCDYEKLSDNDVPGCRDKIKKIIDLYLIKTGENFALSVITGEVMQIDHSMLKDVIISEINEQPLNGDMNCIFPDVAIDAITHILSSKNKSVIKHLRKLSDTYTLFAFLREVPDVQSATKKIFSHGNIWIDTTVMLPLLAESIQSDESPKRYNQIIRALTDSGVKLYITDGVMRELLNHIRLSVLCSERDPSNWQGRVPYLFYSYIELGYEKQQFSDWVERYRGNERPEEDITEYLRNEFNIEVKSLEDSARKVDKDLRYSVERLWSEAHENRRKGSGYAAPDASNTALLIKHDVESYLGIVGLRKTEASTELGYKHWWLTIDSLAWQIRDLIKDEFEQRTPPSPLMSLDFLSNNLSFGPNRSRLDRAHEQALPVFLEFDMHEYMPKDLIEVADSVRQENSGLPEHLIRRKVRDACDKSKRAYGYLTREAIKINTEQDARTLRG